MLRPPRGHRLENRGGPFAASGVPIIGPHGHAFCICGDMSSRLPTRTARKAWFRQHTADVRAQEQAQEGDAGAAG